MRRSAAYFFLLIITASLLLFAWAPLQAQPQNLLTNPGFEPPFTVVDGSPVRNVAQGWTPWHVPAVPGAPSFENRQPEYEPTAPDQARIRSGNDAQQIFSFFATHTGGVYQQVTGVTPGTLLRFSVHAYIWSTTFDDPDVSEQDGDVVVDVGIDPAGGTDAESAGVIWTQSVETPDSYDNYKEYTIEAAAGGSAVTVFVRTRAGVPVKHNYVYLDDASLTVSGPEITPSATASPTLTRTVQSLTNTPLPPTATSTLTHTPVPTTAVPATATTGGASPVPATATTVVPSSPTPLSATATATATVVRPTATNTPPTIPGTFPGSIMHRVRPGDTVAGLAARYNSTVDAIATANGLGPNYLIFVGQELIIPVRIVAATSTPTNTPSVVVVTATPAPPTVSPTPASAGTIYVVQPGDTLQRIARQFNTTTGAIAQLNGIVNPDRIQVGQRLLIPGAPPTVPAPGPSPTPVRTPRTYLVQPGDTLFVISLRFGVSARAIAQANRINNVNLIYIGQVLIIP